MGHLTRVAPLSIERSAYSAACSRPDACAVAAGLLARAPARRRRHVGGACTGSPRWRGPTAPAAASEGCGAAGAGHPGPGGATEATVRVAGGTVAGLPDACAPSTVIRRRSYLSARRAPPLVCDVVDERGQELAVEVRAGAAPGPLTVTVSRRRHRDAGARPRSVVPGPPDTPRRLRLLSEPGLPERRRRRPATAAPASGTRAGPPTPPARPTSGPSTTSWTTGSGSSRTRCWWRATWSTAAGVATRTTPATSGRSATPAQRATAARLAAATYYPQYLQRFREHHLDLYPAAGDHEYGDNPWTAVEAAAGAGVPGAVRALLHPHPVRATRGSATTRRGRTPGRRTPSGRRRTSRWSPSTRSTSPPTTPGSGSTASSCAGWRGCSARPSADGVRWTIVQGHVPILEPVRSRGLQRAALPGRRHGRGSGGSSGGTASTSTSAARCTTSPRPPRTASCSSPTAVRSSSG